MSTTWKGIDVSAHQGDIDWTKVANAGMQFAMVRLGIGSNKGTPTLDKKFSQNVQGALAAGLQVGTYLYSYAQSVEAARQEAGFVLATIAPYKGIMAYPVVYDIEDKTQASLNTATRTAMCEAFLSALTSAGWRAGVYANLDWVTNRLTMSKLAAYDLWLAQWTSRHTYAGEVALWQHTDEGKIAGISGSVDMNICYVDYPSLVRVQGLNGFPKESGGKSAEEPPAVVSVPERTTKDYAALPLLKSGSRGEDVRKLQALLNEKGFSAGTADGIFGAKTKAALLAFQHKEGLAADGIAGPNTYKALNW